MPPNPMLAVESLFLLLLLPSDFPEFIIRCRPYQSQASHGRQEGMLPAFTLLSDESELTTDNICERC